MCILYGWPEWQSVAASGMEHGNRIELKCTPRIQRGGNYQNILAIPLALWLLVLESRYWKLNTTHSGIEDAYIFVCNVHPCYVYMCLCVHLHVYVCTCVYNLLPEYFCK